MRQVICLPSGKGDISYNIPLRARGYYVHSFCCGYATLTPGPQNPVLRVELHGITLMLITGVSGDLTTSPQWIVFCESAERVWTDKNMEPATFVIRYALPVGGLYVPPNAVCRFDFDQADPADQISDPCFVISDEQAAAEPPPPKKLIHK